MDIRSTRVTLTLSIAAVLALLVVVSVSAVTGIMTSNRTIETIHRKWLRAEDDLGALQSTISDFRIAEDNRLFTAETPSANQADFLALRAANRVDKMIVNISDLSQDPHFADDLHRLVSTWTEMQAYYLKIKNTTDFHNLGQVAGYGTAEQRHFDVVHLAASNLIDDAKQAANLEADAAARSAWHTTSIVVVLATIAGLLSVGLMIRVEFQITRPLSAITSALFRLASGDRTIRIPGGHRKGEIGAMAKAFEVFRDNAVALAEAQEALAYRDVLTGLFNRRFFESELRKALANMAEGSAFVVMLIDLDRFKPVNDLQGHAAGDLVLRTIASRLRSLVGSRGTVARLGGDEFALITALAPDQAAAVGHAIELGDRIVSSAGEPIDLGQTRLSLGASVGVAICPSDGATPDDILRTADIALYRAKKDGRGTFRFFETSMEAELRSKTELEGDLRKALETDDIRPRYLPVVELTSNKIVGFEVLPRWRHSERGCVPPDLFIPLAEQIGVLDRLTEQLFRKVFTEAGTWSDGVQVAVHASAKQIRDPAFPLMLGAVLVETGFPSRRLAIEIKEAALMGDSRTVRAHLTALRCLGVSVVLDDFGTDRSSLAQLYGLKIDKIKIDRSCVEASMDEGESIGFVEALIDLAQKLDFEVIGEGIETSRQLEILKLQGCRYGQGLLFGPAASYRQATAMPISEAGSFMDPGLGSPNEACTPDGYAQTYLELLKSGTAGSLTASKEAELSA